jgi:NAD-dependent dihydropyrimidine dehydrogenase PreA subunit
MTAIVDLDKCDGCKGRKEKGTSACVEDCAVECISLVEEDDPSSAPHEREQHAVINAEECTDCETCIDVCEQGAISMVEEE